MTISSGHPKDLSGERDVTCYRTEKETKRKLRDSGHLHQKRHRTELLNRLILVSGKTALCSIAALFDTSVKGVRTQGLQRTSDLHSICISVKPTFKVKKSRLRLRYERHLH